MKRILIEIAVILSFLVAGLTLWSTHGLSQPAEAPPGAPEPNIVVSGSCSPTKLKFRTQDTSKSTASTTWSNMPDMVIDLTVGGSALSCLEVLFSATTSVEIGQSMEVRALMDGSVSGSPAQATFASVANYNAHAFHFGFANVSPGAHKINIQWRSIFGSGNVTVRQRSLFVRY